MEQRNKKVVIIGAGLAGCEAALQLAKKNYHVFLYEKKRIELNPSQFLQDFAELVCSNSLKSLKVETAHGLLKQELTYLNSFLISTAYNCRVPAGDALAVDREIFAKKVTELLTQNKNISIYDENVANPDELLKKHNADVCLIASGPLTSDSLSSWIQKNILEDKDDFYFYDAIAPIVDASSLDMKKLYLKDRYKENIDNSADYLNISLNKEEYLSFVKDLQEGQKVSSRNFEEYLFFESCLPIDLMAERGVDTLRYSCMRPVGLEQENGKRPYAVIQLRKENLEGDAYNLVGFQTRLTYSEQKRIFCKLPGLGDAKFLRFGSVHRNSYLDAKKNLNQDMSSKKNPQIFFAGQLSGVEGYTESIASGLYASLQINQKLKGIAPFSFPNESTIGALINYILTAEKPIPMNINFGILPTFDLKKSKKIKKHEIKKEIAKRCLEVIKEYIVKNIEKES